MSLGFKTLITIQSRRHRNHLLLTPIHFLQVILGNKQMCCVKLSHTGADVSILLSVFSTALVLVCSNFCLITFHNAVNVFLPKAPYTHSVKLDDFTA